MRETREASFPDSRLWSPATRPTSAHGSLEDGRDCTPEGPLVTQICHFGWPYTRGTLAVCSCISTGPEARAKSALGGTTDGKCSYGLASIRATDLSVVGENSGRLPIEADRVFLPPILFHAICAHFFVEWK